MTTLVNSDFSLSTYVVDFDQLKKSIYFNFKEFSQKQPEAGKKSGDRSAMMEKPLPEYLVASLPEELLEALWKARSDAVLKDALHKNFMHPALIAIGTNGNIFHLKDENKVPAEFIMRIRKKLKSDGRLDLTRRAYVHYFFSFIHGTTETAWQQICGLMLCEPFLGISVDISSEDFRRALADEDGARALLDSLGDLVNKLRAFGIMKTLKHYTNDPILEAGLTELNAIKEYAFNSIEDMIKFDTFLSKQYLPFKRRYLRKFINLKNKLFPYLDEETTASFKDVRGWELLGKFAGLSDGILEYLKNECVRSLPVKFSAQELVSLIDRISPPLRTADRKAAEAEIMALENGDISRNKSWLLQLILPALRGERDCGDLELEVIEEEFGATFPYSASFATKLVRGSLSLTEELPEPGEKSGEIPYEPALRIAEQKNLMQEADTHASNADQSQEAGYTESEDMEAEKYLSHAETGREPSGREDGQEDEAEEENLTAKEEGNGREGKNVDEKGDNGKGQGCDEGKYADGTDECIYSLSVAGESDGIFEDLKDVSAELQDYEDHEGMLEPFGKSYIKNCKLEDYGNIGYLGKKTDASPDTSPNQETQSRSRRKRQQESEEEQLEAALRQLMESEPCKLDSEESVTSCEQAVMSLLNNGDTAGLYWLSVTKGDECEVPAWLAEMVHIGSRMTARRPEERDRFATLLKQAIEAESLDETQTVLLAAAIMRPAMLMPMPDMATALQTLENEAILRPAAHIFKKLKEIVFRAQPIPQAILQRQSGKHQAEASLATLRESTKKFLQRMRAAKTQYQPATEARRHMFGPQGELAIPLEKCLHGKYDSLEENIRSLKDPRTYDDIINRNRTRKTNTRNIVAGVRETLRNDIAYCRELLEEWRDQTSSEQHNEVDEREAWYHDTFHNLNLEGLGDALGFSFLKTQIEILKNGIGSQMGPDPLEELKLWPLRLPCSKPSLSPVFQPDYLTSAVYANEQNNKELVAGSLVWHAIRGDYPRVRDFLDAWPEIGEFSPSLQLNRFFDSDLVRRLPINVPDAVKAAKNIWEKKMGDQLEEIENLIVDSYFRGAININQQNEANLRLNDIKGAWKDEGNALETMSSLAALDEQLSIWDGMMLKEVLERVEGLKENASGIQKALDFLEGIASETREDKSYSIAHDNLARMEAWLNEPSRQFPRRGVDIPSKTGAGKEFYDLLAEDSIRHVEGEGDLWREGAKLANRPLRSESLGLITSLLRWLGFNLERSEQINVSYSEGRPQYWKVFSYNMSIKSPLPNWGSRANGCHIIAMGWNSPTPADIDKLLQSGRFHHNDAVTLIVFGSLSYNDRLKIMKMGAEWRPFPLIIDANAFHYLAKQPQDYRRQRMFEICLAGAPLNPYTPDAKGDVPEEMFYGRKKDMDSVRDPSGACVIFGGRQLGKSALLLQIANGAKNSRKKMVLRKSIPEQATSLLEEALKCCIKAGIVGLNTGRKAFPDRLRDWMNAEKDRELLLLLDECDNVLEEDRKRKFAEVKTLRDIMQDTGSRFKVVLTGLHSVQRFSHEPNSPFYQLESICIGPMDTDSAYQLMTEKLALLGINFESQKLVRMALNYCNYQPKLIQMFCHELLETVKNIPDRGPNYTIDRDTMLRVYASPALREKIRDSFTMALALDKRYFVIGYVMALNSSNAIPARKLLEELRDYWPAAFNAENCDANALQTLLQEMEGLGLLISLEGGWRVRTPNIIEFLGGRENILDELVQYEQLPYAQPGNPDNLRMKSASIFTASQYNLLADKSSRLLWISGWSGLGLDRVPAALKAIASSIEYSSRISCIKISGKNKDEAMASLRKEYVKIKEGALIAWISSSEFPNNIVDFMQAASAWLDTLHTDKKYVKIICLISPRDFFRFITKGYAASLSSHEIQLKPWSVPGMESYFLEKDMPANRAAEIMEATNGWPVLIERLMASDEIKVSQIKEAASSSVVKEEACRILQDLPKVAKVVETINEIAASDPIPREDLAAVRPDDMDDDTFEDVITFLQAMSLMREENGSYRLDPIAFPVLSGN